MYVAQIILPTVDKESSRGFSAQPDMYVANKIFGLLHTNAYQVDRNYKYSLGLPELSDKSFGTIMQVFSSDLDDLKKLLKTDGLYEIIANNCSVKFVKVDLDLLKKKGIKNYRIKRTKDEYSISKSEIRRIIKRGNEKSEIVKKAKNGMSVDAIYEDIQSQKDNKKSYLLYKTKNRNNAVFFLKKENSIEDVNFQAKSNGFGFSIDTILPELIF